MKGVVLERESTVVLSLDGSLVYVEDVQPTYIVVVSLPEQANTSSVFTPGRVGGKKISPYSRPDRVVPRDELSERNRDFIANYQAWRQQHGPNYVQRTPEEQAKMTVIKAGPAPRTKKTPEERKQRRLERKAGKIPCVKCGKPKVHGDHQFGQCAYEAPAAKPGRAARAAATTPTSSGPSQFHIINTDLTAVQAQSDKFKEGNRFYRVFRALAALPNATGTLEDIIRGIAGDGARAMTDPEKVSKRALKQLVDAGNVERVS